MPRARSCRWGIPLGFRNEWNLSNKADDLFPCVVAKTRKIVLLVAFAFQFLVRPDLTKKLLALAHLHFVSLHCCKLVRYESSLSHYPPQLSTVQQIDAPNRMASKFGEKILFCAVLAVVLSRVHGAVTYRDLIALDPVEHDGGDTASYRPVIIVHGIFAKNSSMDDLVKLILQAHPGTNVTSIPLFEDLKSLDPLWTQVAGFVKAVRPIMQQAKNGVILLCFSQGGIICRGILETMSDHNVHTFIALSTPQMGQYGDTSFIPVLPKLKEEVYRFCYLSAFGQDISVCNYWNDPHHHDLYLKDNIYLPVLNNQTVNNKTNEWKANFLRLKQLVLIGGPDDGVITPWQSSHFGFYDANETVVEMKDQEIYKQDSFGLKTLDQQKALKTYSIPGVHHLEWHGNKTVFDCCIKPWLV